MESNLKRPSERVSMGLTIYLGDYFTGIWPRHPYCCFVKEGRSYTTEVGVPVLYSRRGLQSNWPTISRSNQQWHVTFALLIRFGSNIAQWLQWGVWNRIAWMQTSDPPPLRSSASLGKVLTFSVPQLSYLEKQYLPHEIIMEIKQNSTGRLDGKAPSWHIEIPQSWVTASKKWKIFF